MPPPALHFREASPGDLPALRAIFQRCLDRADWMPDAASRRDRFDAEVEGERIFLAASSTPLGFISIWQPTAFIHHLYIDPSAQGQGIGTFLLHSLEDHIPLPWQLKCLAANTRAMHFYLHRGWKPIDQIRTPTSNYDLLQFEGHSSTNPPTSLAPA